MSEFISRQEYETRHAELVAMITINTKTIQETSIIVTKVTKDMSDAVINLTRDLAEIKGQAGIYKYVIPTLLAIVGFLAGAVTGVKIL